MQHDSNDRVNSSNGSIELTSSSNSTPTPSINTTSTQVNDGQKGDTKERGEGEMERKGIGRDDLVIPSSEDRLQGQGATEKEKETQIGEGQSQTEGKELGWIGISEESESGGIESSTSQGTSTAGRQEKQVDKDAEKKEPADTVKEEGGIKDESTTSISTESNPTASSTDADKPSSEPSSKVDVPAPSSNEQVANSSVSPLPPTPSPAAPSTTTASTTTTTVPPITKRFSSSLSVNKKFLEKAGEKAHKPEPKLTTTRLSTPPVQNSPVSASHPRLLTGKISSSTTNNPSSSASSAGAKPQLSTRQSSTGGSSQSGGGGGGGGTNPQSSASAASSSSSPMINWSKKSTSLSTSSTSSSALHPNGSTSSKTSGPGGGSSSGGGGAVWSTTTSKASYSGSGPGMTTKVGHYGGIGLGRGGGGGFNLASGDFPTAAEAAHAKELRARAVLEQMQARERALQARAAAAAAQNANLLQNLDAFRGVHLDPNASHWDEDEDDFLDTTIEFGDGTQYKITEEDAAAAQAQQQLQQQEQERSEAEEANRQTQTQGTTSRSKTKTEETLREPSPSESKRLETPLKPGEIGYGETMLKNHREERFRDDFDRSWPPKRPHQPQAQSERIPPASTALPSPPRPTTSTSTSSLASRGPEREDSNRTLLFNDRLGKLEPASSSTGTGTGGRRRMSNSGTGTGVRTSQDLPPHLQLDRRDPSRRPSITSRLNEQAPPTTTTTRNAWPRRQSNDFSTPPPVSSSASSTGGRQLPPHLAAAASQTPAPPPSSSRLPSTGSSQPPPAAPSTKILSPPPTKPLAPLPETSLPPPPAPSSIEPLSTSTSTQTPVQSTKEVEGEAGDLEALHAREMHAAAERAKKRRQEEEHARLEQIERARKKAAELEEKMMKMKSESVEKTKREEKIVEEKKEKVKVDNPWRTTAKPPAPLPTPTQQQAPTSTSIVPPTTTQQQQQPTSILTRPPPPQEKSIPVSVVAAPPPSQPATTWRRPSNPSTGVPPPRGQQQQRQIPPHLAQSSQSQVRSEPSPVPPTVISPPSLPTSVSTSVPPTTIESERQTSPPRSNKLVSPPTVPSSPSASHERKTSATATKSNHPPLGYKVPEVSQLDDLMSRIKGAMSGKETQSQSKEKKKSGEEIDNEEEETNTIPIVKLPPPSTPTTKLPRSRSNDLSSLESRGRGRGRIETVRNARVALPAPSFSSLEPPLLPFSTTSRPARSTSPPPAWKAYLIKFPPLSPSHKAPHYRSLKLFLSSHNPRPVPEGFSSNPLIPGINPRRLNRDEVLIPKRFVKGKPVCPVKIPNEEGRIRRRTKEEEQKVEDGKMVERLEKFKPEVRIARKKSLVRATTTEEESNEVGEQQVSGMSESRGSRGRGRKPDSGSWTRTGESPSPAPSKKEEKEEELVADQQVEDTNLDPSVSLPRGALAGVAALKSRQPVDGFYDASSKEDKLESLKITSELKGEKVEATPREETTPPGSELTSRNKMTPKSPPFKPKDVSSVLSSPSAAWTNKSLALSVLDPTASSVWSATPVDSTVHARTISENQPENSLQGIVDDDPSVALPSSLAELKSEDGHSTEGGKETSPSRQPAKDDAKLRAVAPSFSSFLHDSAAAIDNSSTSSSLPPIPSFPSASHHPLSQQQRPQPLVFSSYGSIPPQSTPSPVNPYSPSATAAYPPHLYGPPGQYAPPPRAYPPTTYGLGSSTSNVSPFLPSQPNSHHHHQHQHFSPASPVTSTALGYPPPVAPSPNLYARPLPPSTAQSIPHGITNPALIANYSSNGVYGGQTVLNSAAARYGAVGAGPRPPPLGPPHSPNVVAPPPPLGSGSTSSQFYPQHRNSYSSQPNASYLSQQQASPYSSPANPPPPSHANSYLSNPTSYRSSSSSSSAADPYHSHHRSIPPHLPATSYDYPPPPTSPNYSRGNQSGRSTQGAGGNNHSFSTTMPSPVILPQHLPPPPFYSHSHAHSHSHSQSQQQQQHGGGVSVNGFGAQGGGAMTNRFGSSGNVAARRPW